MELATLSPPRKRTGDPLGKCPVCKLRPQKQDWFRVDRIAEHFDGMHPETIRRLVKKGEVEAVRFSGMLMVSHESLDAYVEGHSTVEED